MSKGIGNMKDPEILALVATLNYASLYVKSDDESIKFGPGELLWHANLRSATIEQRELLEEKLQRWSKRISA
jgi:hypothetical protein